MKVAQLINMLKAGSYEISGKDICAASDSIRWLQDTGVAMAQDFQNPPVPPVEPVVAPPTPPTPGGDGLKIKRVGKVK